MFPHEDVAGFTLLLSYILTYWVLKDSVVILVIDILSISGMGQGMPVRILGVRNWLVLLNTGE